jgi:hypothetical protein
VGAKNANQYAERSHPLVLVVKYQGDLADDDSILNHAGTRSTTTDWRAE